MTEQEYEPTADEQLNALKIQIIETTNPALIPGMMREWGYTPAPDPGYRIGDAWWAGYISPDGKVNYAWGETAEIAVRRAAMDALGYEAGSQPPP